MKFKLKPMLAAFALVAISGQAAAANTAAAGGSDLLFFLTDFSTKTSFIYDLGKASNFTPGNSSVFSQNITGSAAWNSFIAADANWATNAVWTVANGLSAGTKFLGTTINNGVTTVPSVSNTNVSNSVTSLAKLFGSQTTLSATGATFFGSATGTGTQANLNAANVLLNSTGKVTYLGSNMPFDASNAVGATDVTFSQFVQTGTGTASNTPFTTGKFSFNGATVAFSAPVAPVPEPETWAMMMAGLLMVGSIARRRRSA